MAGLLGLQEDIASSVGLHQDMADSAELQWDIAARSWDYILVEQDKPQVPIQALVGAYL